MDVPQWGREGVRSNRSPRDYSAKVQRSGLEFSVKCVGGSRAPTFQNLGARHKKCQVKDARLSHDVIQSFYSTHLTARKHYGCSLGCSVIRKE